MNSRPRSPTACSAYLRNLPDVFVKARGDCLSTSRAHRRQRLSARVDRRRHSPPSTHHAVPHAVDSMIKPRPYRRDLRFEATISAPRSGVADHVGNPCGEWAAARSRPPGAADQYATIKSAAHRLPIDDPQPCLHACADTLTSVRSSAVWRFGRCGGRSESPPHRTGSGEVRRRFLWKPICARWEKPRLSVVRTFGAGRSVN